MTDRHYLFIILLVWLYSCGTAENRGEKEIEKSDTSAHKTDSSSANEDPDYSAPASTEEPAEEKVVYPEPVRYYGHNDKGEADTAIYRDGNKILTEGYVTGKFIDIQRGDYLHLVLLDSAHWYHTFFVWFEDQDKIQRYWEGEKPDYMQKIKVHWKRERVYLEEARGEIIIYEMIGLEEIEK